MNLGFAKRKEKKNLDFEVENGLKYLMCITIHICIQHI